jgi:dTDP-glucose 4,6-dehydratase|tara:strand:- start:431 stop:1465 length:1035 start_codon:yes stop_codon:yes gene_type:complete
MKKILITGGAGFIAHHLIYHILKTTNWEIISLDRLDYSGNLNRLDNILSSLTEKDRARVKIVFHDLKSELNPWISKEIGEVNIILHLAAGSHVDRSIEFPIEFVMDNVVGTANILEYARYINNKSSQFEKFVYFSTDEVFGPAPDGINYKENDRYNSTNPYSASKAGGEELAVAYENTYNLPVIITHTMNVFGERQHPEKFIPMCIKKIRDGETVTIHSDKSKKIAGSRHYIHAEDVSEAILFLLNTKIKPEVDWGGAKCSKFNIVGAEELTNLELAEIIAKSQNKKLHYEMVDFHSSRPGHDLRYALSGEKMKSLGWTPKIKIHSRIKQVVEWSLNNSSWIEL